MDYLGVVFSSTHCRMPHDYSSISRLKKINLPHASASFKMGSKASKRCFWIKIIHLKLRLAIKMVVEELVQNHKTSSMTSKFIGAQSCLTLYDPMDCSTPGFPVLHQLPRACSNSCPLSRWSHPIILSSVVPFTSSLQSSTASGSFEWASSSHELAKVLEFQLQHPSFQWIFKTGFFRMDSLDLIAVQMTLKLLQHHSSKGSILQWSAFFMVQLSHPYMTTGKTITLTRQNFVSKAKSKFFNMLSRLVIDFLPRSKCLLISWLQSPSAVILEPPKNKVCHCFHCFPIYLPWSDGTGCHDLSFLNIEF